MRARTSLASSRASRTAFARPPSSSLRTTSTTPRLNARSPLASTSRLTLDVPASSRALSTSARLDLASPLRPSPPLSFPRAPRLSLREQQNGENDEFDGDEGREGGEGEGEEKVPVRRPGVPQTEQPRSGLRNPSSAGTSAGTRGSGGAAEGGAAGGRSGDGEGNSSVAKSSVPNVYPQVMALPITRRPLFPGFYKAVVVRDPEVIKAIKESISRGQPYLGAFLLKDENADSDVCVCDLVSSAYQN